MARCGGGLRALRALLIVARHSLGLRLGLFARPRTLLRLGLVALLALMHGLHARGLGARSITLTTPSANTVGLAFYERLGFRRARTFSVAEEAWEGASLELSAFENLGRQLVAAELLFLDYAGGAK